MKASWGEVEVHDVGDCLVGEGKVEVVVLVRLKVCCGSSHSDGGPTLPEGAKHTPDLLL
jgi:hypothetical protein